MAVISVLKIANVILYTLAERLDNELFLMHVQNMNFKCFQLWKFLS